MTMAQFLIALITLGVVLLFGLLMLVRAYYLWAFYRPDLFERDDVNPYRRYCKKCRGRQELTQWSWDTRPHMSNSWWEQSSHAEEGCVCNKHAQYRDLYPRH